MKSDKVIDVPAMSPLAVMLSKKTTKSLFGNHTPVSVTLKDVFITTNATKTDHSIDCPGITSSRSDAVPFKLGVWKLDSMSVRIGRMRINEKALDNIGGISKVLTDTIMKDNNLSPKHAKIMLNRYNNDEIYKVSEWVTEVGTNMVNLKPASSATKRLNTIESLKQSSGGISYICVWRSKATDAGTKMVLFSINGMVIKDMMDSVEKENMNGGLLSLQTALVAIAGDIMYDACSIKPVVHNTVMCYAQAQRLNR